MRETIKNLGKTEDGFAVYEDSDMERIYSYDNEGKVTGLREDLDRKEYKAEKIPKRRAEGVTY